jgi:hypothetical protein
MKGFFDGWKRVVAGIRAAWDTIYNGLKAVFTFYISGYVAIYEGLKRLVSALPEFFSKMAQDFSNLFKVPDWLSGGTFAAPGWINFLEKTPPWIEKIGEVFQRYIGALTGVYSGILQSISSVFTGYIDRIRAVFSWLTKSISQVFTWYVQSILSVFQWFVDALGILFTWLNSIFSWLVESITGVFDWLVESLFGWLEGFDIGGGGSSLNPENWFKTGGVPLYAANGLTPRGGDNIPVMAQRGERILSTEQNQAFEDMPILLAQIVQLLSRGQTVESKVEINGRQFANIILDLSRRNERLTA